MPTASTPHDALFKLAFRHPEHAAAELRHLLPPAPAQQIDWSTLRLLDSSRVNGELREHHADLVYRAELRDQEGLVYIVLEHKSGPDKSTGLQLLRYATRELEAYCADPEHEGRLPYVMAVVVHHDAAPWPHGTSLLHISGSGATHLPIPASCLLNLPYLLDDLGSASVASLKSRDMPALARLALFCLKRARHSKDLIGELRSWIGVLRMVPWATETTVTQQGLLRYIMIVTHISHATLSKFLRVEVGPEAEAVMKTTYEQILEEGEARGMAQGLAKGKAEGMAALLLGQLERRFGPLPEKVVQLVHSATTERLERWAARVLTERTLDQVLAPD